jgi:hypothetical protein
MCLPVISLLMLQANFQGFISKDKEKMQFVFGTWRPEIY